jgi:type IV pilus assembly protein PilC
MTTYYWTGTNATHSLISGEIDANTVNLAKWYLQQKNIRILKIKRESLFSNKKISTLEISIFFKQLSSLLHSGIPLFQCCDILKKSQDNKSLQKIIIAIQQHIESGNSFSSGLMKFPRYFNSITQHLILTGETTGALDVMLQRVADYQEKLHRLKKQIHEALFYPAIIFTVALVVSLVMLIFIVPRFADLFQSTNKPLPELTLFFIRMSEFIRKFGLILVFFILITSIFISRSKPSQTYLKNNCLKLPWLGKILTKIIWARFSRCLATLLSSHIAITQALTMAAQSCHHEHYQNAILNMSQEVARGKQIYTAMESNTLFPKMMTQMVKIGEESGDLTSLLEKIADIYESDINHVITNLSQLLEPLIMVVLGVLIGGLVIAMYLPIFKLGTVI